MPSTKSPDGPRAGNDNAAVAPCPICNDPAHTDYKPFCSRRCADVDLHRWLEGSYAVPVVEQDAGIYGGDAEEG